MGRAIPGFELTAFEHDGVVHDVYRAGAGPAVVVIHEMPGIHPGVLQFARRLVDAGHTVFLPSLFGRAGEPVTRGQLLRSLFRVCVAREFNLLADRTSPVVTWLRALATHAHQVCGGPGVGAIGMCFTGGFALAMAVEPAVLAPVLGQPSLPLPLTSRTRRSIDVDESELAQVRERTSHGLCVLGLRFTDDKYCPGERFEALRRELGSGFESIEINSSPGNDHGIPTRAHAVLTVALVDEPGHPTRAALDRVIEFLGERLRPLPP